MEKQSVFLPGCKHCAVGLQREFKGRDVWITRTAGKQSQKTEKKRKKNLILLLSFHFFIFNYIFFNEMTFFFPKTKKTNPFSKTENKRS